MANCYGATFTKRLRHLGYSSYRDYLNSDHWKAKRAEYRASGLPQSCLACGDPRYQLHHRSYSRMGSEGLSDLLPLCGVCHSKVHEYYRANSTSIQATHKILRMIFGWSKKETNRRFAPFNITPGKWASREAIEANRANRRRIAEERRAHA